MLVQIASEQLTYLAVTANDEETTHMTQAVGQRLQLLTDGGNLVEAAHVRQALLDEAQKCRQVPQVALRSQQFRRSQTGADCFADLAIGPMNGGPGGEDLRLQPLVAQLVGDGQRLGDHAVAGGVGAGQAEGSATGSEEAAAVGGCSLPQCDEATAAGLQRLHEVGTPK